MTAQPSGKTHPEITSVAMREFIAHELSDLRVIKNITLKFAPEKKASARRHLADAKFWLLYFAEAWQNKIDAGAYLGKEF